MFRANNMVTQEKKIDQDF